MVTLRGIAGSGMGKVHQKGLVNKRGDNKRLKVDNIAKGQELELEYVTLGDCCKL